MSVAYFTTAWFAPIPYYIALNRYKTRCIDGAEHFVKQSYRNRCVIATANGPMSLSLPIESGRSPRMPIQDVRVSDHGNWQSLHWNSLLSAYRSSPFFEYYADDIRPFFDEKRPFLFDYNERILRCICALIPLDASAMITDRYRSTDQLPEDSVDFRSRLNEKVLPTTQLQLTSKPYYQVFEGKFGFTPDLSILDLLFNMGPESILYL
ncbi:MAG: WbqC family protein [Bacteroidales bacterium]|nr:WbqC family protein [Bacteroidales bacterium]